MMFRGVAAGGLLLFWGVAQAETFDALARDATVVKDSAALAEVVSPFFSDCASYKDDDLAMRQCVSVRDFTTAQSRAEIFSAVGDEASLSYAPFDPSEKKLGLEVSGCLACARPLKIDDKLRFVTTRVPKAIKAGHAVGLDVAFHDVPMDSDKNAAAWLKKMSPRLRVQFLFKVGPAWKSGAFEGLTFVPVGHRVFDRCNGEVIASEPPSEGRATPIRDAACPEELTEIERRRREDANLPDQLSPPDINKALAPVRRRVHDCYSEFEVAGTAIVQMVVERDGKISQSSLQAPFDKTPTGYCIKAALQGITFPRFKGEKMVIKYPFQLP
jgi:hypothetical protein